MVTDIVNGGNITSPPCRVNIEVVLPCATEGESVTVQLLDAAGSVVGARSQTDAFFLFGRNRNGNVLAGTIAAGTYTIQAIANGVVQPSPTTFTLSGSCVRSQMDNN